MTESVTYDPYASFIEPDHDEMAKLRAQCPVAHTPTGWFVSRYDDVKSVLQRVDDFRGAFIPTEGFPDDELAISSMDEPEHGQIRKIINGAIARHKTANMGPFIRDVAGGLMDQVLETARRDGEVELIEAYAAPIPARVIAQALGVPVTDFDEFQRRADELVARLWDHEPATYSELHPEFAGSLQVLIDERREVDESADDFLSRLMAAGMSDAAVRTQSLHLIIAGNETTRSMLGNCLYRFATEPGLFDAVRADRDLVPQLIEESLRFDPPIQMMGRVTHEETSIGDTVVPACEHVVVGLASANRDASVFERPDEFRLDRGRPKDHLAFGGGPHICPGAFLARLEGVIAVEEFVSRVEAISLVEGHEFDGNPLFWSRAPLTLRVSLVEAS